MTRQQLNSLEDKDIVLFAVATGLENFEMNGVNIFNSATDKDGSVRGSGLWVDTDPDDNTVYVLKRGWNDTTRAYVSTPKYEIKVRVI